MRPSLVHIAPIQIQAPRRSLAGLGPGRDVRPLKVGIRVVADPTLTPERGNPLHTLDYLLQRSNNRILSDCRWKSLEVEEPGLGRRPDSSFEGSQAYVVNNNYCNLLPLTQLLLLTSGAIVCYPVIY